MEKPKTENLTAWVTGRNLNVFQKADAVIEYNKLLDYVKVIEEQLRIGGVVKSFCECKEEPSCRIQYNKYYCNTCDKELK